MLTPEDNMFFSRDGVITRAHFAASLDKMRGQLAGAPVVCNLVRDRAGFSLGLAATLLNGQVCALPPSDAPEAVLASIGRSSDAVILGGPETLGDVAKQVRVADFCAATIDPSQTFLALEQSLSEIRVFSSGSTRTPESTVKTWRILSGGAYVTDHILRGLGLDPRDTAVIGTTPHRHMFGLEATIFAALAYGYCCYRGTVFYPADLEAAVDVARAQGFANIVLVTSPAHLKFLETTIAATPDIRCVISATAPLHGAQAERLEARGNLHVMEIFGSTETGSMAVRRTAQDDKWQLVAGFRLAPKGDGYLASAPHLPVAVGLSDDIKIYPDGKFALLGRSGDMIAKLGKRARVSALDSILTEAPHVLDAVYVHARRDGDDELAIAAVIDPSSGFSEAEVKVLIRRYLLRHVDPVFVPKKFIFPSSIARTATGKVARETARELAVIAGFSG